MDILKISILSFLLMITSSCGKNKDAIITDADRGFNSSEILSDDQDKLQISLNLAGGTVADLSQDDGKPTIIIFSGEFCITCREEHNALISFLQNNPGLDSKVNIYTVFIRVNQQKTEILQNRWGIPWPTAYDQKNDLFNQLSCFQTPCTLVHSPSEGIVYKEEGPFSLDTFVSWTELED